MKVIYVVCTFALKAQRKKDMTKLSKNSQTGLVFSICINQSDYANIRINGRNNRIT